jgi:hypothetical protein
MRAASGAAADLAAARSAAKRSGSSVTRAWYGPALCGRHVYTNGRGAAVAFDTTTG